MTAETPRITQKMVRAAFEVMYPNTAWNTYQDGTTHELIRRMIAAALAAR